MKQPAEATNPPTTNPPETSSPENTSSSKYKIEYFNIEDLSTDTYQISIVNENPKDLINDLNANKLRIQIGSVKTDIVKDSAKPDSDNPTMVNFSVSAYSKIKEGITEIILYSKDSKTNEDREESRLTYDVPYVNGMPGQQPFIETVNPEGGTRGDTITLKGNNFGENIDDLTIVMYDKIKNEKDGEDKYIEIDEKRPFFLSPALNDTKEQELKFNIPLRKNLMIGGGFRKSIIIRLFVAGRPSNFTNLTILPPAWKLYAGVIGVIISFLFLVSLYVILKKLIKNQQKKEMSNGGIKRPSLVYFFELMLTDRATNTYSLSKFQAFAWTIAAIGSYSYIIISQGLLLRNGKIPDFNPTLIALMSISYGGLIAANGLGAKKPKNEVKAKPPQLSNLFCEGGTVDLSRLQLFGFTIVALGAYIYNLILGNPLEGLPDIPPTLLGLMGVSQTGYLGSKAVGKETAINIITPNNIELNKPDITVSIFGAGFVRDTKILLDGFPDPIPTECIVPNELTFKMPTVNKDINKVDVGDRIFLTLLPPAGAPVASSIYLEVVKEGDGGTTVRSGEESSDSVEEVKENRKDYGTEEENQS